MIQTIADGIWCADSGMYMPGGLMHFSLRMTIVRVDDGSLMLISPIDINDSLADEINSLGQVSHIVAPNTFHHLHVATARQRYPEARIYGARGLDKKRRDLPFDEMIGGETCSAWVETLDQFVVAGTIMNEVVFFHRASGTLILTDLIFNIHQYKGLLTGVVLRLAGAHRKVAQSRVWRLLTKDRAAAGRSVAPLCELETRRIIMAHGDIVEKEPRQALRQGLWWMLEGAG